MVRSARKALVESGLFVESPPRDLVYEHPESATENIKITLIFDQFGELSEIMAALVCKRGEPCA